MLAVCIAAILMSIASTPDIFEYNILSPRAVKAEKPGEQEAGQDEDASGAEKLTELGEMLKDLEKRMGELSGVLSSWGVVAYAPDTVLTGDNTGSALLKAQWGARLHPDKVLIEGRQIYLEEFELGTPSAVIDERLAIALYRVGNPIGRKLKIGGAEFTVVGVTKNSRMAGDREESKILVPLKALDKAGIQTKMLSVVMAPKSGSGAYAALSKGMADWQSEGDFYSLSKESYRARLPLRLMLCSLGIMAVSAALKLSGRAAKAIYQGGKNRLESRYAVRMLPEFALRGLGILAMYALNAAAITLILQSIIAPVYIFPEWVPGNLVDPVKIAETFWLLRESETGLLSMRSPELLQLKYLHRLMTIGCAGMFFLMLKPYYLWKKKAFD